MKMLLIIFTLLMQSGQLILGQQKGLALRQYVLEQNKVDSLFVFDDSTKEYANKISLKYLGELKALDGRVFKIMTSTWEWGLSNRGTNRILLYNDKNQFLGNYYWGSWDELPSKIKNNKLIFEIKPEKSKPTAVTQISFAKGIPKCIYVKEVDTYCFTSE
jgi:hypothetical protein